MVFRLKKYSNHRFPKFLVEELSNKVAFNPSISKLGENHFLVIRIFDESKKKIESYFFHYNKEVLLNKINLSEYFLDNECIDYVADPKLLVLKEELFVTFNNGYVNSENNKICIFRYSEMRITDFYYCEYPNRNRIEKNWAFFIKNGKLKVLYSLSPLTVLEEERKEGNVIYFRELFVDKSQFYNNYTIGTQLFNVNETYHFIVHLKIFIRKKRVYIGFPFKFNPVSNKIFFSKKMLIHSFRSLFGSKFKFNKNLISCSYFSGIYIDSENTFLSYGINDTSWGIAKIKNEKLWN